MDELLSEWGLESLAENFRDQGIDLEAAALLNEHDISMLIPQLGPRIKFIDKWKKRFQKQQAMETQVTQHQPSNPTSYMMDLSDFNNNIIVDSGESLISSCSLGDPVMNNLLNTGEIATMSTEDAISSPPRDTPCVSPALKRKKAVLFDVRDILGQSVDGRELAKNIDATGLLDKRTRHTLVVILVEYLITHHGKYPGSFEKSSLAQATVRAFPCLKDPQGVTGYEAFYCKGSHNHPAAGYLEEHLRYVRKKTNQKQKKSDSASTSEGPGPSREEPASGDVETGMVTWMKDNNTPKSKVREYMAATSEYRRRWTRNRDRSVRDVIEEFPCLLLEGMLIQDYGLIYQETANKLHESWETLAGHLLTYATKMYPLWQQVLGLEEVNIDSLPAEQRQNLAFFLVPIMFEKRNCKKGTSNASGASPYKAILDAFIDCQLENTHMESFLENIDETQRPQPFIMEIFTDSILKPQQCFVIIEKRAVPVQSLIEAVDTCYKAHCALDCQYQNQLKGTWTFFEKVVYGQKDGSNFRETPAMRSFRAFVAFNTLE